jgi:NTE family protein
MASAAIPGILPPVCRAGRVLVDGGLADHGEVLGSTAEAVDEIYVLPAGSACALPRAPSSALGVAAQALTLLIQQRLVSAVSRYTGRAKINVLPPLCPLSVPAVDFGHADELISRAHRATAHWLDTGGTDLPHPARFLSLHDHRAPTSHPTPAPTGGSVSRR